MSADLKGLLTRLNPYCTRALEAASGLCVTRSHYEVSIEHMLLHTLKLSRRTGLNNCRNRSKISRTEIPVSLCSHLRY
jgi:hypothetical protein